MHPYEQRWKGEYKSIIDILKLFKINLNLIGNIEKDIEHTYDIANLLMDKVAERRLKIENLDIRDMESTMKFAMETSIILLHKKYGKIIYDIDEKLSILLQDATLKENLPVSYLDFPKTPIFTLFYRNKLSGINEGAAYSIVFTKDTDKLAKEGDRVLLIYCRNGNGMRIVLPENHTIKSCIDDAFEKMIEGVKSFENYSQKEALDYTKGLLALISNSLLYILGDKDVVKEVHPGANPKKKHIEFKDPIYGKQPLVYKVGGNYRKLIERYELDGQNPYDKIHHEASYTVKPHVRAAHYHLYWTGEGRKIPKVKFLMSILVNGHITNFTDMEEEKEPDLTMVK